MKGNSILVAQIEISLESNEVMMSRAKISDGDFGFRPALSGASKPQGVLRYPLVINFRY